MPVDKSKSSRPNSELQDYIESLLFEQPGDVSDINSIFNVTPLNSASAKKSSASDRKNSSENVISRAASGKTIELASAENITKKGNKNIVEQQLESDRRKSKFKQSNQLITHINKTNMSLSNDIPETKNNNKTGSLEKKSSKWGSSKIHKRESGYLKNISSNINSQNTNIHPLTQLDIETTDQRLKNVESLLSKISLVQSEEHPNIDPLPQKEPLDESSEQATIDRNVSTFYLRKNSPLKQVLGDQFQTLVFDVNQLPLAVPLVKLGGIINISEQDITPLVGTPNWFMGLVPHEGRNLLVVDTQQFLMPEKSTADNREYSFLIVLDDSNWALACHAVGDAKVLTPEQVRWSSRNSKRPWFAGMVLEYMSALLEVDNLINLLAENIAE